MAPLTRIKPWLAVTSFFRSGCRLSFSTLAVKEASRLETAAPAPPGNPLNDAVTKAEQWARNHDGWGWRIYRTRAGLRLLATHALFEPEIAVSDGLFDALGADPPVAVDDSYGRETRRAVEAFQKDAGLEADGLAGPETWLAINAKLKQAAR